MDRKTRLCTLVLSVLFAVSSAVAKQSAAELLDEIIRAPGNWSQMCASPPPLPFEVPIRLYSLATPRYHSLSGKNLARLQARRAEVVPEIVSRTGKIDLSKPPRSAPGGSSPTDSGHDPNSLNGVLLQIILELKIVETLPGLLRLEGELDLRLKNAQNGNGRNLPVLDLDGPERWERADRVSVVESGTDILPRANPIEGILPTVPKPQERQLFIARLYQSELLAVMASLLREERFEPLLQSGIEAHYFDWLKEQAQKPELAKIKRPGDIPSDQKSWITFDPIHNLPVSHDGWWVPVCSIPNTPKTRLEIRKLVDEYLQSHPSQLPGERGKARKRE